ncbi:MAG: rhodanese-like domain-containing protein [Acidimicrobiia bacterium]|nr:rhodanese-like domain-containing protein [Acidimicrobiia bacterium]
MGRWVVPALVVAGAVLVAGCGGGAEAATREPVIETISPVEAADLLADPPAGLVILDVRTPEEFAAARLADAVNLDFYATTFADELAGLDRSVPYLLYCRTDNRSAEVREMMRSLGFLEVHEIDGGIVAWAEAGLPFEAP